MSSWKPATHPKTRPPLVNLVWSWARPLAGGREQGPSLILRKMGMQLLTTYPVSTSYPWPSGSVSVCLSKFTLIQRSNIFKWLKIFESNKLIQVPSHTGLC